ncbi:Drebrin protein [Danaus plexippus plexippus]|uniref:Drebrin protein n=1 Tax=Danaus plexippus plexippus TaxID=278856 RepID=A0A212EQ55_DANPL|nr:Drebrin protein [Danaus plexippus plexippus]
MAINLEKHKQALVDAWKDVLDEKTDTNWALFGYDGLTNDLKHISSGDGGLTELIDEFNSGKIQYAFLKVDLPNGSISKYVLINWQASTDNILSFIVINSITTELHVVIVGIVENVKSFYILMFLSTFFFEFDISPLIRPSLS